MKKNIFIVNGLPKSGKDTFCNMVAQYSDAISISSIDQVNAIMRTLGWDSVTKDDKYRNAASAIKDASTEFNDAPFKYCFQISTESSNSIVFVHCRELNEITKLKNAINELSDLGYRAYTLRVERDVNVTASNTGDNDAAKPYPYDIVINNNGTFDELEFKAMNFADCYVSKHAQKV